MAHDQASEQPMGLMHMEVPVEIMDLLRRVNNDDSMRSNRAMILNGANLITRGDTDAGEHSWRTTQYLASKTLLAMASHVINEAVEGGMDSRNCTPTMFLTLAVMLSAIEVHAFTPDGK